MHNSEKNLRKDIICSPLVTSNIDFPTIKFFGTFEMKSVWS